MNKTFKIVAKCIFFVFCLPVIALKVISEVLQGLAFAVSDAYDTSIRSTRHIFRGEE